MSETLLHHLKIERGTVGKYVLLPGDPGRVEKIASFLDNPRFLNQNREYTIYTGSLEGVQVSVMSTGMGGPSAAIGLEELVMAGADTFIRVGTCGGIDANLLPGSMIIPTGAIRKDGTGREYVPIEFPAVPDYSLVKELKHASEKLNLPHHLGVVECKDSYYGQHDPKRMPVHAELEEKWEAWKMAGAIGSEMESSTLFIVASVLRVRCATVLLLCRNREREALYPTETYTTFDTTPAIQVAIEALRGVIKKDQAAK